jgi:hypothetical protein
MLSTDTTNIIHVQTENQRFIVSINSFNPSLCKSRDNNDTSCHCLNHKPNVCKEDNSNNRIEDKLKHIEYNKIIKDVYKKSVSVKIWADYTKKFIKSSIGICPDDIVYVQGICSDDVDAPKHRDNIGQYPSSTNSFLGPFMSGGLSGYPFVGKMGLNACASHVTKTGSLFITSMAHIGISKDGIVGKINRLGGTKPSDTCGAIKASIDWVLNHSEPPDLDVFLNEGDYEFYKIIKILWSKRCELLRLSSFGDKMLRATEIIRDSSKKYIKDNLAEAVCDYVNKPVVFCSGIFINVDYGYDAFIEINYFAIYYPICGTWEDKTDEYLCGMMNIC